MRKKKDKKEMIFKRIRVYIDGKRLKAVKKVELLLESKINDYKVKCRVDIYTKGDEDDREDI